MARDRLVKRHLRERFYFTLISGETYDGLLEDADAGEGGYYVLVDAGVIAEHAPRRSIDGEFNLPKRNVKYIQRPHR